MKAAAFSSISAGEKGLELFNIKPAAFPAKSLANYIDKDRNSLLKCCLIDGAAKSVIAFCVKPNDTSILNGSWTEK